MTSTDSSANSVIVVGNPRAWPRIWARWLPPKWVKSGMLRESVDQKPIMPIRDGKNTFQKPLPQPSSDGCDNSGPSPPAFTAIHASSASAPTITNGAAQFSNRRSVSIPRAITAISTTQKTPNASHCVRG